MKVDKSLAIGNDPLPDSRISYLKCLIRGMLPADRTKARRIAHRAKSFVLVDQELYKWESCYTAFPSSGEESYFKISMEACVVITLCLAPS
jgi:hypothetical protein